MKAHQESGMTLIAFCAQNSINLSKAYYYRLCKICGHHMESKLEIAPVAVQRSTSDISIKKNNLQISLLADISARYTA
ncbi:MAG: IS66 family insertion sequence element accessory protein TnpA [Floccifex sp.]